MLKKFLGYVIIVLTLFYFSFYNVLAHDYIDDSNKQSVQNIIVEIYDAKEQYEDLAGDATESEVELHEASSNAYWWPIGSKETTEVDGKLYAKGEPELVDITSNFGYREDPFGRGKRFHSGLDISGPTSVGQTNIIAAKDGVVVFPTANVSNDCPSNLSLSDCGGGYGNYVIIQHSDGNYTLYGHLDANSITVVAGESVSQGQVIAKMGCSGSTTGVHLHFEVREGANKYGATVDPLNYISVENARSSFSGDEYGDEDFVAWLNSWEYHQGISGEYYIVDSIGDGVRTVGYGVTLENNPQRFAQRGFDIRKYPVGSKIPIEIVDQIEREIINEHRSYIEKLSADNSITLEENQIQALIAHRYQMGNITGFVDNYKKYGNTKEFYDKWFFRGVRRGSRFANGITRRRNAEWSLFHEGVYVYNR